MKLSGLTKMVKRQLVCNVFHNDESDDFYIGTASAIYCATGFPRPLNRNQMGAMLGISEDTMIEKVVYNDFDCAYKIDFQGFNLDDTIKDEVEVKKLGIGIYCSGEILIPLVTEDRHMVGIICQSHLAPLDTFIPFKIDLQDTTGQTEYGTVEYRIGLLTLRQYGKYWRLIPKVDTPWWLATPYGTPNCSPYTYNNNDVWGVGTDGSNGNDWYNNSCGVCPALYFPSTLWVSTEDEGEAGFCLADVPLDDLLAEIKSRAEE